MSSLSQFTGGGATPVGQIAHIDAAPNYYVTRGQEYLRSGNIIAYSAAYADAYAAGLGVFGTPATQPSPAVTTEPAWYGYVGTRYIYMAGTAGQPRYSLDLISWTAATGAGSCPGVSNYTAVQYGRPIHANGSYAVAVQGANTAPSYSSDGITYTSVGGSFATFPNTASVFYANSVWVAGSSLTGAAGEQAYIAAANPSGSWTVGASTNISMTTVLGYSYGAGVWVVTGTSASATAGKIATATAPSAGWTDRTSGSGITFATNNSCWSPVFDGTYHWCLAGTPSTTSRLLRSSNGTNWTEVSMPFNSEMLLVPFLTTNGAGRLIVNASASTTVYGTQPLFASTSDAGATWTTGQFYAGRGRATGGARMSLSYANSVYIANIAGAAASPLRLGSFSLAAPDYVGLQALTSIGINTASPIVPAHVRIK